MIGAAGLKGPGVAAAIMRQRLAAIPRSTRSISTFRPQRLRVPGQGQLTLASSGVTWHKTSLAVGPAAIRFKSSMPEPPPSPVPETTTPSEFVEATDLSDFDLSTIPERIGYLKELGLDYGWGSSSLAQYFVEHLHIWGGMPWWAGIVATGLLFRGVLLPFALMASDQAARSHNVKPLTTPLREEMMRHLQQGNQLAGQQKRAELSELHRAHGIKVWKTIVPLLQIPLGFGIFRATRGMTSLPLPAFMNESFFWIKDLTVADPIYILPMITSFAMYLTFKKGGESGMMDFMKGPGQMILYVLPGMSFLFMAWQPAALQLYFATTGIFAFGQSTIMHNPWVRNFFRMTMPTGSSSAPTLDRTQSAGVARLQTRIAEEKRRAAEIKKQPQEDAPPASITKVSSIDQWIQGKKKGFSQWSEDASKSMNKVLGKSTTNADGTPVAGPRLSDAERKKAEEYEKERKSADAFAREERNHARRQAHMQALAAEREKAKASWQKQQEAAVNNRRRRK